MKTRPALSWRGSADLWASSRVAVRTAPDEQRNLSRFHLTARPRSVHLDRSLTGHPDFRGRVTSYQASGGAGTAPSSSVRGRVDELRGWNRSGGRFQPPCKTDARFALTLAGVGADSGPSVGQVTPMRGPHKTIAQTEAASAEASGSARDRNLTLPQSPRVNGSGMALSSAAMGRAVLHIQTTVLVCCRRWLSH